MKRKLLIKICNSFLVMLLTVAMTGIVASAEETPIDELEEQEEIIQVDSEEVLIEEDEAEEVITLEAAFSIPVDWAFTEDSKELNDAIASRYSGTGSLDVNQDGYITTAEINGWTGTSLNLQNMGITGTAEGLQYFVNLQSLYMNGNSITELPEDFGNLTKLNTLYLTGNNLSSLPESFGDLGNLRYLDIIDNQLTSLPESFGNLINLEEAHLNKNQIASLPESIGDLANLEVLMLTSNKLNSVPDSITNLTNLTRLSLSYNELTQLPSDIGALSNLTSLYLNNNNFVSVPNSLNQLSNIYLLNLSDNQLLKLFDGIDNLANMEAFFFSNNHITELPSGFEQLTNLVRLEMQENQIIHVTTEQYAVINNTPYSYAEGQSYDVLMQNGFVVTEDLLFDGLPVHSQLSNHGETVVFTLVDPSGAENEVTVVEHESGKHVVSGVDIPESGIYTLKLEVTNGKFVDSVYTHTFDVEEKVVDPIDPVDPNPNPTPNPTPTPTPAPTAPNIPNTGVTNEVLIPATIMLAAMTALLYLGLKKKRA